MKTIFTTLVVLGLIVVALGFYRGWFTVTSSHYDKGDKVNLTVDREKMKEDTERAEEKAKELTDRAKERIHP